VLRLPDKCILNQAALSPSFIGWQPQPGEWILLNTDSAAKGDPDSVGAGGVFKGSNGKWILGYVEEVGVCTSIRVELGAILRGLKWTGEKNVSKL